MERDYYDPEIDDLSDLIRHDSGRGAGMSRGDRLNVYIRDAVMPRGHGRGGVLPRERGVCDRGRGWYCPVVGAGRMPGSDREYWRGADPSVPRGPPSALPDWKKFEEWLQKPDFM